MTTSMIQILKEMITQRCAKQGSKVQVLHLNEGGARVRKPIRYRICGN